MKTKIVSFIFVTIALTLFLTIMLLVPDFVGGMFEDGINGVISNLHKWTHSYYLFEQLRFTFVLAVIFALIYLFFTKRKQS
jgi:ABC-type Fe3+ transport system permease subunit